MAPGECFLTALRDGIPDIDPIFEYLFRQSLMKNKLECSTVLYKAKTQAKLATIKTASSGGEYIIASNHSLPEDIASENVYAFIEAVYK